MASQPDGVTGMSGKICQKQLPRYLPREIVPRTASSRAQLSAVIATVFDMTVRPLPDPTLRPAPFLAPPRLFGVI